MPISHKPVTTRRFKRSAGTSGDSLRPVTQIVRPLIKKILPQKSAMFQQVFDMWPDIVGATDAAGTIPEKIVFPRDQQNWGILSLWAKSSGQAMELTYNKAMLLQRINSVFGYAMLADIRVMAYSGMIDRPAIPAPVPRQGLTGATLTKALKGVANPALKLALSEFGSVLVPDITTLSDNKGENHA